MASQESANFRDYQMVLTIAKAYNGPLLFLGSIPSGSNETQTTTLAVGWKLIIASTQQKENCDAER